MLEPTTVYTPSPARYDSMPVGSSRRAVMTMRVVSDGSRLRLFGGHVNIVSAHHPMGG